MSLPGFVAKGWRFLSFQFVHFVTYIPRWVGLYSSDVMRGVLVGTRRDPKGSWVQKDYLSTRLEGRGLGKGSRTGSYFWLGPSGPGRVRETKGLTLTTRRKDSRSPMRAPRSF